MPLTATDTMTLRATRLVRRRVPFLAVTLRVKEAFLARRITDFRMTWLAVGVAAGLVLSYIWPHEPALAVGTDRSDKFVLSIIPVDVETDAIFVLDFLTGRLQGHVMSNEVVQVSHAY